MGSMCKSTQSQTYKRLKIKKRYPALDQLKIGNKDEIYFTTIPIDDEGYCLKITRILYDKASRCFIPNVIIPNNKISIYSFRLVKFNQSMMFGICTEKCFGVPNPTFNKDLNAVHTFDGQIYNSSIPTWNKAFQRIQADSEIIMKVDTINWKIEWIRKDNGKEIIHSTQINQNMKAECLYPTIIIRGEGDVAALTVYD